MSKTILIADTNNEFLNESDVFLQKHGYEVIVTDKQKEAEDVFSKIKPDLAIFELMLDNEDSGFYLCYKLKKKYPDVPIIIISEVTSKTGIVFGLDTDEERKWIKADAFLEKGMTQEQLYKEILKHLKN